MANEPRINRLFTPRRCKSCGGKVVVWPCKGCADERDKRRQRGQR